MSLNKTAEYLILALIAAELILPIFICMTTLKIYGVKKEKPPKINRLKRFGERIKEKNEEAEFYEQKLERIELENIENYGSAASQREVE